MKRMMSKPAATSNTHRPRPQPTTIDLSSNVVRRTASSDLGSPSCHTHPHLRGQQNARTVQNSFLSFSATDIDIQGPSTNPWSPLVSEPPMSARPPSQPEVKRKRSLLKKSRPPAQAPHTTKESPASLCGNSHPPLPGASPKILTPAASLVEEYRESERRRAKLAQAAGKAFSNETRTSLSKVPDNGRSISASHAVVRNSIQGFDDETPFSDYHVPRDVPGNQMATGPVTNFTPRKSVERPSLRINIQSSNRQNVPLLTLSQRPSGPSLDYGNRKKAPNQGEAGWHEKVEKIKASPRHADVLSTEGTSSQSSRIWNRMKRLSLSVLRERPTIDSNKESETMPPVPAVPNNTRYFSQISRQSINQKRIDNFPLSANIALSPHGPEKRSSITVNSSGISSEATDSGILEKHLESNRSSTSSYGEEIDRRPFRSGELRSDELRSDTLQTQLEPSDTSLLCLSKTLFSSRNNGKIVSDDDDVSSSPLIPTFNVRGNIVNRFDEFDKVVLKPRINRVTSEVQGDAHVQFSFAPTRPRASNSPSPHRGGLFNSRKSTDGARRSEARGKVEIDFDFDLTERRRTRSLDRLLSGRSVIFRALNDHQSPLTEEQKDRRWEELIRQSDLAGGTISVSASPVIA
jgi:hypothetical protein